MTKAVINPARPIAPPKITNRVRWDGLGGALAGAEAGVAIDAGRSSAGLDTRVPGVEGGGISAGIG